MILHIHRFQALGHGHFGGSHSVYCRNVGNFLVREMLAISRAICCGKIMDPTTVWKEAGCLAHVQTPKSFTTENKCGVGPSLRWSITSHGLPVEQRERLEATVLFLNLICFSNRNVQPFPVTPLPWLQSAYWCATSSWISMNRNLKPPSYSKLRHYI